jgi:hypothetical protein
MDALPIDLTGASLAARDRLGLLARQAAAGGGTVSAMASAARAAVFADALLGAIRARLEELRTASK